MAGSVRITYDSDADILYIAFGSPTPSTGYELGDQILLRLDPESHRPTGLTIRNFACHARSRASIPLPDLAQAGLPGTELLTVLRAAPIDRFLRIGEDDRGLHATLLHPPLPDAVAA